MATTTTNVTNSTGIFSGLATVTKALRSAFWTLTETNSQIARVEKLGAKSDAELAQMGLTRDQIPAHVFRHHFV